MTVVYSTSAQFIALFEDGMYLMHEIYMQTFLVRCIDFKIDPLRLHFGEELFLALNPSIFFFSELLTYCF